MCRRCLRSVDDDALIVPDYASSIACTEDGDDASLIDLLQNHSSQQMYCPTGGSVIQVRRQSLLEKLFGFLTHFVGKIAPNWLLLYAF